MAREGRLKLLIISHACALPENQRLFANAAALGDWDVTLVIPKVWMSEYGRPLEATLLPGFQAQLIPIPVLKNGSVPLHFYRTRATRLLKQVKADVVYSHNEPYALSTIQWCFANARSLNAPFGFYSCQNLVKRYPSPFRQAERWVYRKSRFAFPITRSVEDVHRFKGFKGESTILPLGFDASLFPARTRSFDKNGPFRLAFIGRVVEAKGLLTLVNALASLTNHEWILEVLGSGPYEGMVKEAAQRCGIADRIRWRGFIPQKEVADELVKMNCVVLPSETRRNWKEQFGRVLIESLACGVPVIGSDSGEIPIIIRESGGGIVFRESDASSCAEVIQRMMLNGAGRQKMAEHGERFVRLNYDLSKLAERFVTVIDSYSKRSIN